MPTNDPNTNETSSGASSDILSTLLNQQTSNANTEIALLKSIDKSVKDILKNGAGMSQANAVNRIPGSRQQAMNRSSTGSVFSARSSAREFQEEFKSALRNEMVSAVFGSDFKSMMQGVMNQLAEDIGVSVEGVPKALAQGLAKKVSKAIQNSQIGSSIIGSANGAASGVMNSLKSRYLRGRDAYWNSNSGARDAVNRSNQARANYAGGAEFAANWRRTQSEARTNAPSRSELSGNITAKDLTIYAQNVSFTETDSVPETPTSQESESLSQTSQATELSENGKLLQDFLKDQVGDEILNSISNDTLNTIMSKAGAGDMAAVVEQLNGITGLAESGVSAEGIMGLAGADTTGLASLSAGAGEAGAAIAGLGEAAAAACPYILIAIAAIAVLAPAIEGTVQLIKKSWDAATRYEKSRQVQMDNAQKRLMDDVNTMVEEPFNILKEAAEEMYDVWDNNLRTINGTQGYSKDDLQTLIGNFAERLRDEGLTSVVSASSITENLTKVLESGLSGTVAEEFAYLATKLNAAIPTQDFFSYASTYSSIAANAIKNGASQSEAIETANEALEGFANNILYASREVAGGFTTGLKDAESLFEQSVQIAQASKTGDSTEISAVMTAVSAITGAIAPDLATSMTDAIYKAATGGNSSEIVALRSLAGINASNTEFLKKLAEDPQTVFANLFNALAEKQNMSQDAYMEVAEGLSSIFGVSSDAFARVDFAYLAQAISSMDASSDALLENIDLLASGETTTTAEQLKMQQINEYMLDEGLSYVLDNAAARAIQQHMWDEQMKNELMEATYGVELQGSALEFLEGIRKAVDNVLTFLNPVGFLGKVASGIANLVGSMKEGEAQKDDVKQLLELGKVGEGNSTSLYQLTTRGTDLNLTSNLIDLMGGVSAYETASSKRQSNVNNYRSWLYKSITPTSTIGQTISALSSVSSLVKSWESGILGSGVSASEVPSGQSSSKVSSRYSWGSIGKSASGTASSATSGQEVLGISLLKAQTNEQSTSSNKSKNSNFQNFLGSMESYLDEHKGEDDISYDDWIKTASRFGISDVSSATEEAGVTEESMKGQFESFQTAQGVELKQERERKEEQFWIDNVTQLTTANTWMETIYNKQVEFFDDFLIFHEEFLAFGGEKGYFETYHALYKKNFEDYLHAWTEYFVEHTAYKKAVGYDSSSWSSVKAAENSESRDAVYKLAEALTKNNVDLLDPTVQTNVLLAEILQVVNAISLQENDATGNSLAGTIAGMALGSLTIT